MASINGISIKKLKKSKTKDDYLIYRGDLYAGDKKLAYWEMGINRSDRVLPESDVKASQIINTIRTYTDFKESFECTMYDLAVLTEDEHFFRMAKKEGYAGVAVVSNDTQYIAHYLLKDDLAKDMRELLKEELEELKNSDYKVYSSFSDFVLGDSSFNPFLED